MESGKKIARVALLGLFIMSHPAFASGAQAWLFDISYTIAGIEQTFPATQQVQCLTEDAPLPDITGAGQRCGMSVHGQFGNTFTWQLDCSSEWEIVQGVGRMSFENGHAEGDVHMQILSPVSAPQFMVFHLTGVAEGRCNKAMPGIVSSLIGR